MSGLAEDRTKRTQTRRPAPTMLHAFNNPIRTEDLDEDLTMLIGPDPAGNLYEIGVVDTSDGPIIIHAMAARPKYLR